MQIDLEFKINFALQERLLDLSYPLDQFGQVWRDRLTVEQFEAETTADGRGWEGLSPPYLAWKRRKGYPTQVGKATQETFNTRGYAVQKDSARLRYSTSQAYFFNKTRPLFTRDGSLPRQYRNELSDQIAAYLNG